jgi:hypothetical protein
MPLLTPHSSLLTPHSSLLTPHSSLLTPHSSLLTTGLNFGCRLCRTCLTRRRFGVTCVVVQVLKRPPYQLLEGDFVRAECSALTSWEAAAASAAEAAVRGVGGGGGGGGGLDSHGHTHHQHHPLHQTWRVLKKDEVLDWGSCVAKIMTNRRSHWQNKR